MRKPAVICWTDAGPPPNSPQDFKKRRPVLVLRVSGLVDEVQVPDQDNAVTVKS